MNDFKCIMMNALLRPDLWKAVWLDIHLELVPATFSAELRAL